MSLKSGNKGRYIQKVGHLDIYAKDSLKPAKTSKLKWLKGEVKNTEYVVYHAKKIVEKGFKGVWLEPLGPGKYPINKYIMKVELVPTTNLVLNWASARSEAHNLDKNLNSLPILVFELTIK